MVEINVRLIAGKLLHQIKHRRILYKALDLLLHSPPKALSNTPLGRRICSPEFFTSTDDFIDSGEVRRPPSTKTTSIPSALPVRTPSTHPRLSSTTKTLGASTPKLADARRTPAAPPRRTEPRRSTSKPPSSPSRRAAYAEPLYTSGEPRERRLRPPPDVGAAVSLNSGEPRRHLQTISL